MSEGGGGGGSTLGLISPFLDPDFYSGTDYYTGGDAPEIDNLQREFEFQGRKGYEAPTGKCRDRHLPLRGRWLRERLGPDGKEGIRQLTGSGDHDAFFGVIPTGLAGEPRHRCMDRIRQVRAPVWVRLLNATGLTPSQGLELLKAIGRGEQPAFGGTGQVSPPPAPPMPGAPPPGGPPGTGPHGGTAAGSNTGLDLIRAAGRGVRRGTATARRIEQLRALLSIFTKRGGTMAVGGSGLNFFGGEGGFRLPSASGTGDFLDSATRLLRQLGVGPGGQGPPVAYSSGLAGPIASAGRTVGTLAGGAALGDLLFGGDDTPEGSACVSPKPVQQHSRWPSMFKAAERENGSQVIYTKAVVTSGDIRKIVRSKMTKRRRCPSRCRPR